MVLDVDRVCHWQVEARAVILMILWEKVALLSGCGTLLLSHLPTRQQTTIFSKESAGFG